MFSDFFTRRSSRVILILLVLFSLACTQIPLLNYLGFEFSAATALFLGYLSGLSIILICRKTTPAEAKGFWRMARGLSLLILLQLSVPLIVMALNALFVKNCSLADGLFFYGMTALPAAFFSSALGMFISTTGIQWPKTSFTAVFLAILLHIPIVTFISPQIFAFNPFLGFFPGLTHDEALEIKGRLLLYRVTTLMYIGALVFSSVLWIRHRISREASHLWSELRKEKEFWLVAVLAGTITASIFWSDHLGFSSSESFIKKTLGGLYRTDHFDIVYDLHAFTPDRIEHTAMLHEFYYDELQREFRVNPRKRMTSFIYGSPVQKEVLLGAARTDIAKPWLRQLHINQEDIGRTLKHELVHVVAADFGLPILRIAINPGLIEGAAVAAERINYDELLHRSAAQILALGLHPPMEDLFSVSGFARVNSGVGYTLAGSFCRFLIDRYGIPRFKVLYQTGNFRTSYHRDLQSLSDEWQKFVSGFRLTEPEFHKARYLFTRPTIFSRECARVLANLTSITRTYLEQGSFEKALLYSERSLGLSRSPEATLLKARSLYELRRFQDLIGFANAQLKDTVLGPSLLTLRLTLGDAFWAEGSMQEAREQYQLLLATHLSNAWDEACALRLEALASKTNPNELREYFTVSLSDSARLEYLRSKVSPVAKYCLGREFASGKQLRASMDALQSAGTFRTDLIEFLRRWRIAKTLFDLKQYQRAKIHFWESLNYATHEASVVETKEWLDRCEWMDQHTVHQ